MHFQRPPYEQAKLVSVVKGAAYDVAIDLRSSSKTFGKWYGIELHEDELKYIYIPRGFAHGFLSLSDTTCFCYKVDNFYNQASDGGIHFADDEISIRWPPSSTDLVLSQKDLALPSFSAFKASVRTE